MPTHLRRIVAAVALACALPVPAATIDVPGLDRAIDPCTDFYRFANRKWLESTTIPDDRTVWSTGAIIGARNEAILEEALKEAMAKPLPPTGDARKVIQFYRSGMDTVAIEKAGLAPLAPLMAIVDKVDSPAALARAMAELENRGVPSGPRFSIGVDDKDSSRYIVELAQGGLGLPDRDYYLATDARSSAQRDAYRKHLERMFALAGDEVAAAKANAERVFALETDLARASSTRVERRDPVKNYNLMRIANLDAEFPGLSWREYLRAMHADKVDAVNVGQPAFFRGYAKLAAERPMDQWRAYLRWRVLSTLATKLPQRFEDEAFAFNERELRGTKSQAPRHRRVVLAIGGKYGSEGLGHGVGRIFVEKAFSPTAKARALELVNDVKASLEDRIRTIDWMSEEARKASLEKLAAMDVKIGYPDKGRDFSDANVGDKPFAENWLQSRAYDHRRLVARLDKPVDRSEWGMAPYIVNAYYNPNGNEIVFPAAILQPPFFDEKADDAYNYGGIGMIIGHEITHGFDDTGRQFDARGNLREWWTPEDARRYTERARRAVKQYSQYEGAFDTKTNGELTLGENLADVGGLKIAYGAFQRALKKHPSGIVEGLTPEQRFFIAFAQDWRSQIRPERERELLLTDTHSLARYRVKGPLMQIPEFASAFSCDVKQALLPEAERTNLW